MFGGGVIPDEDIPVLEEAGLAAVFTPGSPLEVITTWVSEHVPDRA